MKNHVRTLLFELEENLNKISYDYDDTIEFCNNSINETLLYSNQLKAFVLENSFENQEEEIYFFKHLKPKFSSKLIYFKKIMKLEKLTPVGGTKTKIEFFKNELLKLNFTFAENTDFYLYYRHNNEYIDKELFTRRYDDVCPNVDPAYFGMDHRFNTSHDNLIADILANDMIQIYIENKIKFLKEDRPIVIASPFEDIILKWTGKKVDGVELIYALHAKKVFNNGDASLIDIARFFEKRFGLEVKDLYGTFSEIKERNTDRTRFMDSLSDGLEKHCAEESKKAKKIKTVKY